MPISAFRSNDIMLNDTGPISNFCLFFNFFYLLIILPIIQALDRLGHVDEVINDPEYAFSLNLCSLVFLRMDMNISLLLASA